MARSKSPYPRRAFNQLLRRWLAQHRLRVLGGIAIWLAAGLPLTTVYLLADDPSALLTYVTGFVHAFLALSLPVTLLAVFLVGEQEAIWQLRGAWGEDFTREELARAKRKKSVWGWVDSIGLAIGDIDHLVVTRNGGIIAIDSKYRSSVDQDWEALAGSAKKSALRASGALRSVLPRRQRGRRRSHGDASLDVAALVVMWGPGRHAIRSGSSVSDVVFVQGPELTNYLAQRQGQSVDKEAAREVLALLGRFRDTQARIMH